MKKLFLLVSMLISCLVYAQHPSIDSVYTTSSNTIEYDEDNNITIHLKCGIERNWINLYFQEELLYNIDCKENCSGFDPVKDESYLGFNTKSNRNPQHQKFEISNPQKEKLFDLYIKFDLVDSIKEISYQDDDMIICSKFIDTTKALLYNNIFYYNRTYETDSNLVFQHLENNVLVNYNTFEDIPLNEYDSIKVFRLGGEASFNGCATYQEEDTLKLGWLNLKYQENQVKNILKISENQPNVICPNEKTYLNTTEDSQFIYLYKKGVSSQFSYLNNLDSIRITKPGEYFLSDRHPYHIENCPIISNSITIEKKENCKGYLSYYVKNNSSTPLSGVKVKADNGQIEISDENGKVEFQFPFDNIISKIEIADTNYHYSYQVFELDREFPYYKTESLWSYLYSYFIIQNDLSVSLNSGRNRPGFKIPYYITLNNKSKNEQTTDVSIRLDAALSYNSDKGVVAPDQINGNKLTWENITVASGSSKRITFYANLDRSTPLGSYLESTVELSLSDDNTDNNADTLISEVTGSYDPNDKLVSFNGFASQGYVHDTTQFEYTVRFQNTGSDTAFTVRIEDVIDKDFDLASIQVVDASHNYRMTIDNDTVNWIFEDILLVDSTTNEPASHGFIRFTIAQNANNPEGTLLTNQASIFFDFNDPIITNEVVNEVGTPPVLATYDWEAKKELSVYPNPTSSTLYFPIKGLVTVYDAMGNVILSKNVDQELDVRQLESGIYYYEVSGSEQQLRGRFVKQ